jgi:hypothetical protein
MPKSGNVVHVGPACGVQFAAGRDVLLRVTSVEESKYWDGMAWLTGYVLDRESGAAVDKRELYVAVAGLRYMQVKPQPVRRAARNQRAVPPIPAPRRPVGETTGNVRR